jgi:hypothetical protein
MYNKPNSSEIHYLFLTVLILLTLLAACAPTGTATPETAVVDTATAESTETAIVRITATQAPTITTAPSLTPTATLSPEEADAAEQAAIRAEVLSYGINLDDLTNSENEYVKNYPELALIQQEIDSPFNSEEPDWEMMVVLDIEQLKSVEEYEQIITTDGGWKFIVWAKVSYKQANGDWGIANLPLTAYNAEQQTIWEKYTENSEPWLKRGWAPRSITNSLAGSETALINAKQEEFKQYGGYYLGTGAIFSLYTEYPNPENHYNAGEVGETPSYSPEEMAAFRLNGDPYIFVAYRSDISYIDHQQP